MEKEFINFLSFLKGSFGELKFQLYSTLDKKLITKNEFENISLKVEILKNKIGAFIRKFKQL